MFKNEVTWFFIGGFALMITFVICEYLKDKQLAQNKFEETKFAIEKGCIQQETKDGEIIWVKK
jgi:hypothetical protein